MTSQQAITRELAHVRRRGASAPARPRHLLALVAGGWPEWIAGHGAGITVAQAEATPIAPVTAGERTP